MKLCFLPRFIPICMMREHSSFQNSLQAGKDRPCDAISPPPPPQYIKVKLKSGWFFSLKIDPGRGINFQARITFFGRNEPIKQINQTNETNLVAACDGRIDDFTVTAVRCVQLFGGTVLSLHSLVQTHVNLVKVDLITGITLGHKKIKLKLTRVYHKQ